MPIVTLQLPPEVLSHVADLDLGEDQSATSLVAIDGLDTDMANLESNQLSQRLSRLSEVLREWVFHNAGTAAISLTIVAGGKSTQLDLPPNVSVDTIMNALSDLVSDVGMSTVAKGLTAERRGAS